MISSEGEFRNGKKYAKLAYLLSISGNSGIQKRMAFEEKRGSAPFCEGRKQWQTLTSFGSANFDVSSKETCEKHSHLEDINNEVEGK